MVLCDCKAVSSLLRQSGPEDHSRGGVINDSLSITESFSGRRARIYAEPTHARLLLSILLMPSEAKSGRIVFIQTLRHERHANQVVRCAVCNISIRADRGNELN